MDLINKMKHSLETILCTSQYTGFTKLQLGAAGVPPAYHVLAGGTPTPKNPFLKTQVLTRAEYATKVSALQRRGLLL